MRIRDSPSHPICRPHSQTHVCFALSFCLCHVQALAACPAGGPTALGDWAQGLGSTHSSNPVHLKREKKNSAKIFLFRFLSAFGFCTQKHVQPWGSIFWCCGDHLICEMTKGHKTTKTVRSRVSEIKKGMPFKSGDVESETTSRYPRSWKQKQRSWMMAGLRKLGAPVVTRYRT